MTLPLPDEPHVHVVARWRDGRASQAEILALRRFVPELKDRPIGEVFNEARSSPSWVLAVCHPSDARRICEAASREGLVVVVETLPALRPVSDEEVVAELTASGHAVTEFFLVGGLICWGNPNEGLMARIIDDPALASATRAYLRRVGVREYASHQEFVDSRRDRSEGSP